MTALIPDHIEQMKTIYRDGLLEDIIPFWVNHSVDSECGGFLTSLDRDGTVIDTDKAVWLQGRFIWMLATLYNTVEPRDEWLQLAQHGIDFLDKYCFDEDGRMYFTVTRDGQPLRKRRYVFSELFTVIAYAEYAKATNDDALMRRANELLELAMRYVNTPGLLEPKTYPETRSMKGIGFPMILINTAQILRNAGGATELCDRLIEQSIREVENDFMKSDLRAVLEVVSADGQFLDTYDGRTVTPGHAIEAAWFILEEAAHRENDPHLIEVGTTMIDWMWEMGWDEEYGGLFYFRDVLGKPVQEYWHDMKFWWPHNEAVIATLYAYHLTGNEKYARWHQLVHEWAFRHFPDAEHGEWYGYLHRDGTLSVPLKGNLWKGGFHVPRMYWKCWQLLESMTAAS